MGKRKSPAPPAELDQVEHQGEPEAAAPVVPEAAHKGEELHSEEIGILLSRTKDGARFQLMLVTRVDGGEPRFETKGLQPRAKFLIEYLRALDWLKNFVYHRGRM